MKRTVLYFACLSILLIFTSCENQPHKGIVTFYGTVTKSGEPISGVEVKIGGSDTPGGSTITGSDGAYELPVIIIPTERKKTMTFVLIANNRNSNYHLMSEFGITYEDAKYIGKDWVSYVAYGYVFKIGWQVVGEKVHHSFSLP